MEPESKIKNVGRADLTIENKFLKFEPNQNTDDHIIIN